MFEISFKFSFSDLIMARGISSLKNIISQLGGWPVVDGDNWHETSWQGVVKKCAKNGIVTNFPVTILPITHEFKNLTQKFLMVLLFS